MLWNDVRLCMNVGITQGCGMCAVKDKAAVLMQVEELTTVKDELTEQVSCKGANSLVSSQVNSTSPCIHLTDKEV